MAERQKREEQNGNSEEIRKLNKMVTKEIRKDIKKFNIEMIKQTSGSNRNMKIL
jgi:hypothetical protein